LRKVVSSLARPVSRVAVVQGGEHAGEDEAGQGADDGHRDGDAHAVGEVQHGEHDRGGADDGHQQRGSAVEDGRDDEQQQHGEGDGQADEGGDATQPAERDHGQDEDGGQQPQLQSALVVLDPVWLAAEAVGQVHQGDLVAGTHGGGAGPLGMSVLICLPRSGPLLSVTVTVPQSSCPGAAPAGCSSLPGGGCSMPPGAAPGCGSAPGSGWTGQGRDCTAVTVPVTIGGPSPCVVWSTLPVGHRQISPAMVSAAAGAGRRWSGVALAAVPARRAAGCARCPRA